VLRVEIADTPARQAHGLMFRKSMPDDSGMLFSFKRPDNLRFWGVNTFLPLDIAFVNRHNKIAQISEIKPMCDNAITSKESCSIAIEANLGWFAKNNIRVGHKVTIDKSSSNQGTVRFSDSSIKSAQFIGMREDGSTGVKVENQTNPSETSALKWNQLATQGWDQNLPTITMEDLTKMLEDNYDENQEDDITTELMGDPVEPMGTDQEVLPEQIIDSTEPEEVEIPEKDFPEFENAAEALPWATANKEVMHIWYTTKGGRDIEREIEPHGGFIAKTTGNAILVAYDQTINDIRAFIIDNILYHQFTDKQFEPKFIVSG
jgi:uncharacterized protein